MLLTAVVEKKRPVINCRTFFIKLQMVFLISRVSSKLPMLILIHMDFHMF